MRLRIPSLHGLSISLAALAAMVFYTLGASYPTFNSAQSSLVAAGFLGLVVWLLVEQWPEQQDGFAQRRYYLVAAVAAAIPAVGRAAETLFSTTFGFSELGLFELFGLLIAGALVAGYGSARRTTLFRAARTAEASLSATTSRRREFGQIVVSSTVGVAFAAAVLGGEAGLTTVLGSALAGVVIALFSSRTRVELVAYDDGLVAVDSNGPGSIVPWRRIRRLERDGDRLLIHTRVPWLPTYRCDLSESENPGTVVDSFQRCRRHV
ncbi:hypothetical protein AUR64_02990 [Haloprofundus marisrubri]|uniref:Uncharacterized protein n=1 Tax=Haloprofundus marisrubri TaxID=1514971 RepID=A0A0W1R2V7_9EURY|nr:hypothetical protein [Haloprofundus marisrubri]KTG07639.1 hypothetical protein AUR64_02990 [Haloprofundus marisrubri]